MAKYECGNCGEQWRLNQLVEIKDLLRRLEPGDTVPHGQCPACEALCCEVEPGSLT